MLKIFSTKIVSTKIFDQFTEWTHLNSSMVFTSGTRKAPGDLLNPDTVRGYDVRFGFT